MPSLKKKARLENIHRGLFGYPAQPESILRKKRKKIADEAVKKFLEERKKLREPHIDDERFRILAEAIPQIVWTADPDGYQDYFNRRWFEYTGFTEAETFAGKTALHPEDFPVYVERWTLALKQGKAYEAEYRIRGSDGTYRWFLVRGVPVHDPNGKILKWFGTFTDIQDQKTAQESVKRLNEELERKVQERTRELEAEMIERKRAQEQERVQLERLRNIIDTMPVGVIIADERANVLHINDRFFEYFDLPSRPKEFIGMHGESISAAALRNVLHPQLYRERLQKTLRDQKPIFGLEVSLTSGRTLLRDYLPVFVAGKCRGHVFLYRDVTKEKRIDAAKSEFMSLASHQLRTPLTSIRWALGRLGKAQELESPQLAIIDAAKKASVQMSETISTMLSIARIEAGVVTPTMEPVRVQTLLEEVSKEYQKQSDRRHHSLRLRCASSLVVHTDAGLLREVIDNLISNAIKYSPDRSMITMRGVKNGSNVLIEIRDEGYGIPERQQERVFQKFFRADNVIEKETEGTGLGLHLAHLIMRTLRGSITFSSKEGEGTTFEVLLPAVNA